MYECDGQMNIFDIWGGDTPMLTIDKPIRLIEFFAGYGSQMMALKTLGANVISYKISEWEVHACASYKSVHCEDDTTDYSAGMSGADLYRELFDYGISVDGKKPLTRKQLRRKSDKWKREVYNNFRATNNLGSICNFHAKDLEITDTDKYAYILTYSFPCQDLSVAGKGLGMSKGSGTRSGLLWEVERILQELVDDGIDLPQVLLMENVPQVHGKKNMADFEDWCKFLESIGYTNFWEDMSSKHYGVAQNRNRTFMVSVLGNYNFEFPKPIPLTRVMKDYLEDVVEEKYYINNEKAEKLIATLIENGTLPSREEQTESVLLKGMVDKDLEPSATKQNIASTLLARDYKGLNNFGTNGVIEWKE